MTKNKIKNIVKKKKSMSTNMVCIRAQIVESKAKLGDAAPPR